MDGERVDAQRVKQNLWMQNVLMRLFLDGNEVEV